MSFGLPWPFMAFMHWPTKKPIRPVFPPLYCSTLSGLAASTSSTTASMAPVSDTGDSREPAYSFEYDLNAIIVAIRDQHGVDLSWRRKEPFHWWEFLLLFKTLSGDHYILNLMEARTYRGKDRELLRRKHACALPPEYTAEEQAERDAFNAQFATGWENLTRAEEGDEHED